MYVTRLVLEVALPVMMSIIRFLSFLGETHDYRTHCNQTATTFNLIARYPLVIQ